MATKEQRRAARRARRQDRRDNRNEKIGGLLGNLPQGLQNTFGLNQQAGAGAAPAGTGTVPSWMALGQQQGSGGGMPGSGVLGKAQQDLGGVQQNPAYGDPVFPQQTAQTFGAIADPNQVTPSLPLGTAGAALGEEEIDEQIV